MTFRKGIVRQDSVAATAPTPLISKARTVRERAPEPQPQRSLIVQPNQTREPAVRGMLVDTGGRIHRGLSPATLQAHHAHTEAATEQCRNCGEWKPPAQMDNVIGNAYNPNNPLRMCLGCKGLAYRDPKNPEQRWQPAVPMVRFDRERGNPYDAHKAGVTMSDLTNRDTYHRERDVDASQIMNEAPRVGQWSGGTRAGHAHTSNSLAESRDRIRRR